MPSLDSPRSRGLIPGTERGELVGEGQEAQKTLHDPLPHSVTAKPLSHPVRCPPFFFHGKSENPADQRAVTCSRSYR